MQPRDIHVAMSKQYHVYYFHQYLINKQRFFVVQDE